jgi:Undecaprenyl-phosphate galactose phosphotransferase WbaP
MDTYSELNEKLFALESPFEIPYTLRLRRFSRALTKVMLVLADLCGMVMAGLLALGLFESLDLKWEGEGDSYLSLSPLLLIIVVIYILIDLNRSRNLNQVEELRQLTITTTVIFLSLFAFDELIVESKYPEAILVFTWLLAIGLMPLARFVTRCIGSRLGIWGEPVVILGCGELSRKIIRYLIKNTYHGLRPVMLVAGLMDDSEAALMTDLPIPTIPLKRWLAGFNYRPKIGIRTAIIVTSELPASLCGSITRGEHLGFRNIITVSKQFNTRNVGIVPIDFDGILGLEERHYELNVIEDLQVRILDLLLIFSAIPILVPLFLCIIAAIKLNSKGRAFYRQTRIGKRGRKFKVVKFRTMVEDADKVLAKYLKENPELLAEWKADHKLKHDPRITRIGNILRKTSLDELPQLWNVLKGEMSLVGPRPIVSEEIERYGDQFKYYAQVPPGITGLWQVSGRNDVTYQQRVQLDEYYVRNRSIWLNLHIIIRTTLAVIRQHGAY